MEIVNTEEGKIAFQERNFHIPTQWSDLTKDEYLKLSSLIDNQLSIAGQGCQRTILSLASGQLFRLKREVAEIKQLAKFPLSTEHAKRAIFGSVLIAYSSSDNKEILERLDQLRKQSHERMGAAIDQNKIDKVEKIMRLTELVATKAYIKRQEGSR